MGCVASRLEDEEEVVSVCRERKRLMKLAVERRYALADAHCRYCHSLYAVSAAIKLFVARHSTPTSPFYITFPPPESTPENFITNPMFLQQNPSKPTKELVSNCCESSHSSSASETSSEENGKENVENVENVQKEEEQGQFGYDFYMGMSMTSPQRDFGWDFFNPFTGFRPELVVDSGAFRCNEDDYFKAVREQEGIPDLEDEGGGGGDGGIDVGSGGVAAEEGKTAVVGGDGGGENVVKEEEKGLSVKESPVRGRELLDALKDIEDHFVRAYDCGKDVSRMLEANKMNMQSNLDEIKENSTKLIQAITWHRSNTSRSSSCKSLAASSSKNSSSWTEYKNDLFDDYGGMAAGSHSLTLGRLYAWEKKLYAEVKAGDSIRKLYEKKCAQLRNKDVRGEGALSVDKTRVAAKDLYSRILVAIRRAESISDKIQKLTAEELQPQIIELLGGLTQSWKIMLESHETQSHIIFEVKTFDCPCYGKFTNDSHRLATLQLEAEIQNWRERFTEYVEAQRSYVEALHSWASKFIVPELEFSSRGQSSGPLPYRAKGPPVYMICHDWLLFLENLPDRAVALAMRSFVKDIRSLWVQQGEEKELKSKVDKLAKELEKKMLAYQKVEGKVQETKLLGYKTDLDDQNQDESRHQTEYLTEKKDALDNFWKKLDLEKGKHHDLMQKTQQMTLNGFQSGFSLIFDTLVQFSMASHKFYNDLVNNSNQKYSEKAHGSSKTEVAEDTNR